MSPLVSRLWPNSLSRYCAFSRDSMHPYQCSSRGPNSRQSCSLQLQSLAPRNLEFFLVLLIPQSVLSCEEKKEDSRENCSLILDNEFQMYSGRLLSSVVYCWFTLPIFFVSCSTSSLICVLLTQCHTLFELGLTVAAYTYCWY